MDVNNMIDFDAMTVDELDAFIHGNMEQRAELAAIGKMAERVRTKKLIEQRSEQIIERMTGPERQALTQALQAKGIESGESFGQPG